MDSFDAKFYTNRGNDHYNAGNFQAAITDYTEAIALAPQMVVAYFNRGIVHYALHDYPSALKDYTEAIELDPQMVDAFTGRGLTHYALQDYLSALKDYTEAIRLDRRSAAAYFNRGVVQFNLNDYPAALKDFTVAIQLAPQIVETYYRRGQVNYALQDYRSALQDYTEAIGLAPQEAAGYFNRGVAQYTLQDYASALEDFTEAIRLAPQLPTSFSNRGLVHYALQDYRSALQDYTEAIRLDDQDETSYYKRGQVYYALHDYQSALLDYAEAIRLNPQYDAAYFGQGLVQYILLDYPSTIKSYTEAIRLNPQNSGAYSNRGLAHKELYDYPSAIQDFTEAIRLDDQDESAYTNRGLTQYILHNYPLALKDLTEAIGLNSQDATTYVNRGKVYSALHEYQSALQDFTDAIRLNQQFEAAYFVRGLVHYELNNYRLALQDFTDAIGLDSQYAEAYAGRGLVYYALHDYSSAIREFTDAIQSDSQLANAYYNRGLIFTTTNSYIQAQSDFVRYIFFNPIESRSLYKVFSFFRDYSDVPFVVIRFLKQNPTLEQLQSYQSYLLQVQEQCKSILNYLDFGQLRGWANQQPRQYKHLMALCQYFMGDTAEAFRIFNEEIDQVIPLSLLSHYYYVQSAIFSSLPENNIDPLRKEAIQEAERRLNASDSADLIELYYAGLIFYHYAGNIEKAQAAFQRAKSILPALYMVWSMAPDEQKAALGKTINEREKSLSAERSFAKGLTPRLIDHDFSNHWVAMQHYCFYQEIALAVHEFHASEEAFKNAPFYEYWGFKVTYKEQEEIINFRKVRQAEQILSEIDASLMSMKQRVDYLQVEEEIELAFNSIFFRFEQLKEYAQNHSGEKLELRLAAQIYEAALNEKRTGVRIRGFRFLETQLKFVSYFFLLDKISTRTTVYLFLYALFSAHRFDADILAGVTETAVEDGILDTVKGSDKVKEITNDISGWIAAAFATTWGASLATFLISFSVKALWLLIKDSQQDELTEYEQPGVDYADFKKNIAEQLILLKASGTMIPEFDQIMK